MLPQASLSNKHMIKAFFWIMNRKLKKTGSQMFMSLIRGAVSRHLPTRRPPRIQGKEIRNKLGVCLRCVVFRPPVALRRLILGCCSVIVLQIICPNIDSNSVKFRLWFTISHQLVRDVHKVVTCSIHGWSDSVNTRVKLNFEDYLFSL